MSTPNDNSPQARLRHHVTGAIERGEATPIVAQPSPAAVELALAEEKANQEKISATVQAARASATQPQQVKGHNPRLANDWYNLIQDDPRHAATVASSTCRRLLAERDELGSMCAEWSVKHDDICKTLERLQAQRDELLAACRLAHAALTDHGRWLPDEYQQAAHACSAAIARATSKQGQAK